MERYSEYKDSGVEWIGEIPAGWSTGRISSLYEQRNEKVSDKDYQPLSVTMRGIVPQLETAAKTQDGDNRKLVKAGDFAINSRSDRRGSCGISPLDGSVSLITNVLAPIDRSKMNDKYYELLYQSEGFSDEYYRWGTGIVDDLWSTNWMRMKNILIPVPPVIEQSVIAAYLLERTTEIDALVADQERSVELLQEYRKAVIAEAVTKGLDSNAPMKDSGVDWIGEIPAGWKINKLKYLCSITSGATPSKSNCSFWAGEIPWVSSKEVKGELLHDTVHHITQEAVDSCSTSVYQAGTYVAVVRSGILKRTIPVAKLMKPMAVNQDIKALEFEDEEIGDWFALFVSGMNDALLEQLINEGSTVDNLNAESFANCPICIPPKAELRKIAHFCHAKTVEVDSLISDKQQLVAKLKEYRKSLISEAVTGKLKVPGVVEG